MRKADGIIVILSYPDTVVRPAYWERSSRIWPYIGIGGKHAVQAGHAALLLIQKDNPKINYYDFGRYITTYSNGRVRSKETDPEVNVTIKAEFNHGNLKNLKDILLWLEKHPEKTHGEGRLVATLNDEINFENAIHFINNLIEKKEVPYGAFIKNGTNCARFVTDAIIASTLNKKVKSHLKNSKIFTPSPIGNVIKANTTNKIYQVENQSVTSYKNRSILKEYKTSFFKKFDIQPNLIGTELPDLDNFCLEQGTWLGGIGSGAWFNIEQKIDTETYLIARYNVKGIKEFEYSFIVNDIRFNMIYNYNFMHPSNFKTVFIQQGDCTYNFTRIINSKN